MFKCRQRRNQNKTMCLYNPGTLPPPTPLLALAAFYQIQHTEIDIYIYIYITGPALYKSVLIVTN